MFNALGELKGAEGNVHLTRVWQTGQHKKELCRTMVQAWQLDRDTLGTLYHLLQRIKSQWSTYRTESLMRFIQGLHMGEEEREQQWQQEYDRSELAQEEAQFTAVIGQVCRLWVSV